MSHAPGTTRLSPASYLAHLRVESSRFREVVSTTSPHARVPSCPDWDVADLLWHLAEVQWFWSGVVGRGLDGPPATTPQRPGTQESLLAFFDASSAALGEALHTDPTTPAWSWADEQTAGFSQRRQAHEALVHRLDAEQAAGAVTALPADLAADGVAELMDVMHGGEPPTWGRFTPSGRRLALELTDTGHRIRVATGLFEGTEPESGRSYDGPHLLRVSDDGPADCVVAGAAADLDAWLWRRRDDAGISVDGDPPAYAEWRAAVDQPLD